MDFNQHSAVLWYYRNNLERVFARDRESANYRHRFISGFVYLQHQFGLTRYFRAPRRCSNRANYGDRRMHHIILIQPEKVYIVLIHLFQDVMSLWQDVITHSQLIWYVDVEI